MHYPYLFTPLYKEMIWGGDRLRQQYQRMPPFNKTGESWDVTCRTHEMSVVENGPEAGSTLSQLIKRDKTGLLGSRLAACERFPLLIKIIDACDNLSVQVHPGDAYAGTHTDGESGKNEMWYVLTAPTNGELIIGLHNHVTKDFLHNALITGKAEDCLYRLPVRQGDIVNIPAGLVHALTKGVMVAEVQQNSDVTYRLYDYNRTGLDGKLRALHIADALAVTDFDNRIPKRTVPGLCIKKGKNRLTYAIANQNFAVIKYDITETMTEYSNTEAFTVFTCVEGHCQVATAFMTIEVPISRSVLIPAAMGAYELRGRCVLLKSFVPHVGNDFIKPLKAYGYTDADIRRQTAADVNIG